MKSLLATLLTMGVALLLVVYILSMTFASKVSQTEVAGIDQTNPSSSYEQKTNHFPMPNYSLGPVQGSETPFQVNQWKSYEV